MVARYLGAVLALFAFTVAIFAGLFTSNPPVVVLSRAILALFAFFLIGLILGGVAQLVIREHEDARREQIRQRYEDPSDPAAEAGDGNALTEDQAPAVQA